MSSHLYFIGGQCQCYEECNGKQLLVGLGFRDLFPSFYTYYSLFCLIIIYLPLSPSLNNELLESREHFILPLCAVFLTVSGTG